MHVDHLVALAVAVEAVERVGWLADRYLEIAVEHQEAAAVDRIAAGFDWAQIGQPVHVRLGRPLLALERSQGADLGDAAGRMDVVEDRLVAREPLVAHHLFDEQTTVVAHLRVPLARDLP